MTLAHLGADAKPNCVYRYYDHAGRILYVGITARGGRRQDEHNASSEFFQHVRNQQVEQCHSRDEALRLERELIKAYRPPFNKVHNEDWEILRAAYLGIVAAEVAYELAAAGLTTRELVGTHVGCPRGEFAACVYFSSAGPKQNQSYAFPWCGDESCASCHSRWHGYMDGVVKGHRFGLIEGRA